MIKTGKARLRRCQLCRQEFTSDDLQNPFLIGIKWVVGGYCASCFKIVQRENTYRCRECLKDFYSPTSSRKPLCSECRKFDKRKAHSTAERARRNAKKRNEEPTLTDQEWQTIIQDFEGKCAYCQNQPYEELDHFIPPNQGGKTTAKNCVPACKACNNDKGTFNPCNPPIYAGTLIRNGTRDILLHECPRMTIPLLEGIERVAKYLDIPFLYRYHSEWASEI